MRDRKKIYDHWNEEKVIAEGRKYDFRNDFNKLSPVAYNYARVNRLLDEIFKDKPNLGYKNRRMKAGQIVNKETNKRTYWTEERIMNEIVMFPSIRSFCIINKGAASAIYRLGLGSKIKSIMPSRDMDYIKSFANALKYSSIQEFREKDFHSFMTIRKHGMLKIIKKHLKK